MIIFARKSLTTCNVWQGLKISFDWPFEEAENAPLVINSSQMMRGWIRTSSKR